MKTLGRIFIVLAFLMLNAYMPNPESKLEKIKNPTFEVYAIHELEVKSGVDSKEFENFIIEELTPIYNKMEGQTLTLVKGDRGERTDKYAIILTFKALSDRNRIYPPSGEFVGDFGSEELWERFEAMVESGLGARFTDYIKVVH